MTNGAGGPQVPIPYSPLQPPLPPGAKRHLKPGEVPGYLFDVGAPVMPMGPIVGGVARGIKWGATGIKFFGGKIAQFFVRVAKPPAVTAAAGAKPRVVRTVGGGQVRVARARVTRFRPTPKEARRGQEKWSGSPKQDTNEYFKLRAEAVEAKGQLGDFTENLAKELGGDAKLGPLKKYRRTRAKIVEAYEGNPSGILDLARSSVICDDASQIERALQILDPKKNPNVVRIKNRFDNPTPEGYRDILANVRMPNGHVCEIQVHLKNIIDVKDGPGHALYNQIRELNPKETAQALRIQELGEQSRALYDAAWKAAGGK